MNWNLVRIHKSVSPLIATILLVVVAVVLVTILLNFGKNFTTDSLDKVTSSVLVANNDLTGYITVQSAVEGYDKATLLLTNNHKEKSITITSYKIIDDDYSADFIDKVIDLNQNIDLNANSSIQFPLYFFPSNNFDIYLITEDNTYIKINVTPNKRDYDNFKLKDGLIFDMPLAEPYTEAGSNMGDLTCFSETASFVISGNTLVGTATVDQVTSQNYFVKIGKKYYTKYTLSSVIGGSVRIEIGNNLGAGITRTTDGTYTEIITATGSTSISFDGQSAFTGIISNVVVKELDGTTKDRTPNGNDGIVNGATLKHDGLVNTANGIAYIPSTTVYGTWEFDINKDIDGHAMRTYFINNKNIMDIVSPVSNGYYFYIHADESLYFVKCTDGGSNNVLWKTGIDYIDINTDYKIKITRSLAGVFTVYIKGGSFGWDNWTLVDTSGGSGSNPVTDNTYTTSNYFVTDLDAGDSISNLKINGKKVSLNKATVSSGSFIPTAPSYEFDGIDDYIDIDLTEYTPNLDITISGWFKTTSTGSDEVIYATSNINIYLCDVGIDEGKFVYDKTGDGSNSIETVNSFNDGSYHHFLITTNNNKIYIDNIEQTTHTASMYRPSQKATIGARYLSGSYSRFFNGQISNLKIWNRILSSDEINFIYNKEKNIFN